MKSLASFLVLLLTLSLPLPGGADEFHDPFAEQSVGAEISDPLESLNRASFWVNDKIYRYLLSPLYGATPSTLREGACALFATCLAPVQSSRGALVLRFRDAGSELGRYALFSVLRLFEGDSGADGQTPDLDRVLARAGVGSGPYLVLPVLGPSTVRDGVGKIASFYLESPTALLEPPGHADPEPTLGESLKAYLTLHRVSLDPYLSVRSVFAQQHEKESRGFLLASHISEGT